MPSQTVLTSSSGNTTTITYATPADVDQVGREVQRVSADMRSLGSNLDTQLQAIRREAQRAISALERELQSQMQNVHRLQQTFNNFQEQTARHFEQVDTHLNRLSRTLTGIAQQAGVLTSLFNGVRDIQAESVQVVRESSLRIQEQTRQAQVQFDQLSQTQSEIQQDTQQLRTQIAAGWQTMRETFTDVAVQGSQLLQEQQASLEEQGQRTHEHLDQLENQWCRYSDQAADFAQSHHQLQANLYAQEQETYRAVAGTGESLEASLETARQMAAVQRERQVAREQVTAEELARELTRQRASGTHAPMPETPESGPIHLALRAVSHLESSPERAGSLVMQFREQVRLLDVPDIEIIEHQIDRLLATVCWLNGISIPDNPKKKVTTVSGGDVHSLPELFRLIRNGQQAELSKQLGRHPLREAVHPLAGGLYACYVNTTDLKDLLP